MKRRDFLKALIAGVIGSGLATEALAKIIEIPRATPVENYDDHIKDYLYKIRHFNRAHEDDVCLDRERYRLLRSSVKRLKRLQRTVGHGRGVA